MSILFLSEGVKKPKFSYKTVAKWIKLVISNNGYIAGRLLFIFCNDNYLLDINVKFLKHDFYTDIITFDYTEGIAISGDIFISVERVLENSVKFKSSFEDELLRVLVHGILHLLGYCDSSSEEKIIMRRMEEECIKIYKNMC